MDIRSNLLSVSPVLLFLGGCLLTFALYFQASNGPMILDDKPNIVFNEGLKISQLTSDSLYQAATSMQSTFTGRAPLLNRPVSYISFGLNYYFFDDVYLSIKVTNIILHILCAALIYAVVSQLLPLIENSGTSKNSSLKRWVPMLVASAWLLHPLMVSTVLYSVQRMTILSALFSLIAINCFLFYRQKLVEGQQGFYTGTVAVGIMTILAFLSKENGVLTLLLCGLIELCFFRNRFHPNVAVVTRGLYYLLLSLPAVVIVGYLINAYLHSSDALTNYRLFDSNMRLMTESRVLFSYLHWLIWPVNHLLTFLHDSYPVSRSLFDPVSTIVSILLWITIVAGAVTLLIKKKSLWLVFGIGWYLVAHVLESSVINLELVFEHRNYLPYIGPIFLLVWGGASVLERIEISHAFKLFLASLILVIVPASLTAERIKHWQSEEQLISHWVEVNPQSPRAWAKLADYYFQNNLPFESVKALNKGFDLAPWEPGFGFAQLGVNCGSSIDMNVDELTSLKGKTVQALKQKPNTAYSISQLNNLIRLCNTQQKTKSLEAVYKAASQQNHPKIAAKGYYMLAMIKLHSGDRKGAKTLIERVLKLDKHSSQVKELYQQL